MSRRLAGVLALTLFTVPLVTVRTSFAQSPALSGAAEEGGRLFRNSCANCHGERGDMIVGVDLGHGKFKRASTDAELSRIILNGIPGTGMPPNTMAPAQAASIVAYLRAIGTTGTSGDAANGQRLFASSGCANCHGVLGQGSRVGPDLSEIGSFRKPAELEQSLRDPDAEIQPENRTFRAVAKDGTAITGRVLDEDAFGMRIIDSKARLLSLNKAELREYSFAPKSGMPSFAGKLSDKEIADVVAYLSSLKRMDAK